MSISSIDNEIIEEFSQEAKTLIEELSKIIETIETPTNTFPFELFKEFSLKIDRIMGAANTINTLGGGGIVVFETIGSLAKICKALGNDVQKNPKIQFLPLFAAFWSDVLELLSHSIEVIEDEAKCKKEIKRFVPILKKRLEWLAQKVGTNGNNASLSSQDEVDDLLNSLL